MSLRIPQRLLVVVAGFATLLLVSGCSGSGADNASSSTSPSPSASPTLNAGDPVSKDDLITVFQQASTSLTTAHMEMVTAVDAGGSSTMTGDVDYTTKPVSMTATMTVKGGGANQEIKMVLVDGVIYMNLGAISGGKYFEYTLDQMSALTGTDFAASLDPFSQIKEFSGAFLSATYKGSETVNGAEAFRYSIKVDPKKLSQLTPAMLDSLGNPKSITYDIWVDGQGRMAQFVTNLPGSTTTVTYSDYGVPVTVTAPPASEVTKPPSAGA